MGTAAIILGVASIIGTLIGVWSNNQNNEFIDQTNEENREFQQETNLQNHQWALESAQWEYDHNKPQRQYSDLLAAGLTPAAAAQKISGANVSYSPATAVAPQNIPNSTNMLNDSLQQVISNIGNYSSMTQAEAAAAKTRAETKVISETAINKANAEIDNILASTFKSFSDINVNNANIDLTNEKVNTEQLSQGAIQANIDLTNEKVNTEQVNRRSIELTNEEKEIQLEFTRKTLEMSLQKTEAEIKLLSEQTAKLQEEVDSMEFEQKYQDWRNTYIETYGVAPEQGWEDTLFKAVVDGKAKPMLDAFSESLRQIFDYSSSYYDDSYKSPYQQYRQRYQARQSEKRRIIKNAVPGNFSSLGTTISGAGGSW